MKSQLDLKQLVLALPAAFLLLSADRLAPDRFPPQRVIVKDFQEAAPVLPSVDEGRFGRPGDPLNLVFVGSPRAVRKALTAAGWIEIPTSLRGALAAGMVPMNDYRLLGRRQSMNWALPVRPLSERHHFRLWNTGMTDGQGRSYWWGTGNYDLSIRWSDFSHTPDPDMDRERDYVASSLARSPLLDSIVVLPLPQIPAEGVNDKGYRYRTDGRAAVIVLKRERPAAGPSRSKAPVAARIPAAPRARPAARR